MCIYNIKNVIMGACWDSQLCIRSLFHLAIIIMVIGKKGGSIMVIGINLEQIQSTVLPLNHHWGHGSAQDQSFSPRKDPKVCAGIASSQNTRHWSASTHPGTSWKVSSRLDLHWICLMTATLWFMCSNPWSSPTSSQHPTRQYSKRKQKQVLPDPAGFCALLVDWKIFT